MTDQLPVFVLDEGIGIPSLLEAIRDKGVPCELLIDHFSRGTPDAEWLPQIGKKGWILITKDKAIPKNRLEYQSLMNARVGAFFLVSANLPGTEIIACITKAIPKMLEFIKSQKKPFLAKIYKDGSVVLWKKAGQR